VFSVVNGWRWICSRIVAKDLCAASGRCWCSLCVSDRVEAVVVGGGGA